MKLYGLLSTLLISGAVSVTATPLVVEQRQAEEVEYQIANFTANTLINGTGAIFSFKLEVPSTGVCATCTFADNSSDSGLPDVTPYHPCDDPTVTWQFRKIPLLPPVFNYLLTVTAVDPSTGRKHGGGKEWPASDFPVENHGSTEETIYRGTPNFTVVAS